ncbi:hypothetical protein A5906_35065 [Bradyrhizobium sacchari]|uniref:Uncharacterized protein DUF3306 n=1 Tax=Bradyrhizobium sacchari TaxID=1399419 RepID=A0A560JNN8_9BRAD|nr:DUF3306 domain-containing protein [Bradyrhizobium sacchari]OPY98158.1 hypothetical protein A5906_35065 [Bradyrhizobium sacchari]TWB58857.1 uncharacterized protein DUF3306 [Bradyrhizobium sacchari]TWB72783.1 uncharacterized protein DUF3306 [Bradyrhizobium sacchari]
MSEDKFLPRWSRLKQEAKANAPQPDPAMHDNMQPAPAPATKDDDVEFDLSSLPSIDSITSATDIKAFLRKGIPQELTRAALRRAWSADPTIRDFVGLAENAWDFNDPSAMPGFGPLDCSEAELAAFVDRIIGGISKGAETLTEAPVEVADSSRELRQAERSSVEIIAEDEARSGLAPAPAAAQRTVAESTGSEQLSIPRRTHGGALPR